jgi:hypothetical protein
MSTFLGHNPLIYPSENVTGDVVILVTADEWTTEPYDNVMAINHCLTYRYRHHPRVLTLVPSKQSFFPLLKLPQWSHGSHIGIVGSIDGEFPRNKNLDDVYKFLDTGSTVVHFTHKESVTHPNIIGRYGLSDRELIQALLDIRFLWLPIPHMSGYMSYIFTGPLAFGVSMNIPMIMPDKLRIMYGFPVGSVLTYEDSILEVDFDKKISLELMNVWKDERANKNAKIFQSILDNEFCSSS